MGISKLGRTKPLLDCLIKRTTYDVIPFLIKSSATFLLIRQLLKPLKLSNMTTEEDLILAVKDTLENDGTLRKFKAEMRTKIMDILNGRVKSEKPHLSSETLLLNELIRDYLTWNGYKYTKSVFIQESGLSSKPLSRSQLLEDLGVYDTEESSQLSILHGIVAAFKEDTNKQT